MLAAAGASFDKRFCAQVADRLPPDTQRRLEELIADIGGGDGPDTGRRGALAELKADPGQVGLETLLNEIAMLEQVRSLPADLFAGCSEKLLGAWRGRSARCYPSDLRASAAPVRLTLLACLCWVRTAEITDSLVDLLIGPVHKINARAERRVEGEDLAT